MERETDDAPPRPEVGGEDDRSCSIIRNHRHRAASDTKLWEGAPAKIRHGDRG